MLQLLDATLARDQHIAFAIADWDVLIETH